MDLLHLLNTLEGTAPQEAEAPASRRAAMRRLGRQLAAALPLTGALALSAQAQTSTPAAALDYALRLKYLSTTFLRTALGTGTARNGLSATNQDALLLILQMENQHVTFLRTAISGGGGTPLATPSPTEFDFTMGRGTGSRPFADVYTNPATLLVVAQLLMDLLARAFQDIVLLTAGDAVTAQAMLNLQSVQARHSARVRTMRRGGASVLPAPGGESNRGLSPKSWVSGQDGGGPLPTVTAPWYGAGSNANNYPAEGNVTQFGGGVANVVTVSGLPTLAISEAFDEPLDAVTVRAIARNFTLTSSTLFA